MHTPEQAKELWCPMVRHSGADGTFNRGIVAGMETNKTDPDDDRFLCNCIADQCAMWRWAAGQDPTWVRPTHPPASFQSPPLVRSSHGYCGIAGRPEVV